MQQKSVNNEIITGSITRQLLLFFFPILFGAFFQQLYNTVDAIIIGRYVGTTELAAVGGSSGVLINLLFGFFYGVASGATIIIAQYYGAGDEKNVREAVHTAVALSIAIGAFVTVIGVLFCGFALRLINTPEDVIGSAQIYLRVYFLGMIPNIYYNISAGILRAVGDSKRPLHILIAACLSNVLLDLIFVVFLHMGVLGVGLATILCQTISAVLITRVLMKTEDCYRLEWKKVRFHPVHLKKIVRIGIPAGLQSVMYNIANIIIQSNVNLLGSTMMASYTAFNKMDAVFWMMVNAFGISVSTFVGQNYGAGKIDRVRKSMRITWAMAFGSTITLSLILLTFGRYIYMLFTPDPEVVEIGMEILRFMAPILCTYVTIEVISGTVRAMGFVTVPTLMTCLGVCVLRIIWLSTYVPKNRTIQNILFSYPLSWVVTSILFIAYYIILEKKGKIRAPMRL